MGPASHLGLPVDNGPELVSQMALPRCILDQVVLSRAAAISGWGKAPITVTLLKALSSLMAARFLFQMGSWAWAGTGPGAPIILPLPTTAQFICSNGPRRRWASPAIL